MQTITHNLTPKMHIGYDGKRAVQNLTGLGNYSRVIVEAIARTYPEDQLTLFAPSLRDNPRLTPLQSLPNVSFRYPAAGETRLGRAYWRTFGITRLLRPMHIELFHGLSNELPLNIRKAGIPTVLTMHDVIYRTMPSCYSPLDWRLYDLKYGASCRAATRIIAISECTRRDIVRFYGVDPEKIDVVYQGCDDIFKQPVVPDLLQKVRHTYQLPDTFVLQVGSIERRKNAMLTVQALPQLPPEVHLVLVGGETLYLREVLAEARRLRVDNRILVLRGVPFPHLPALYRLASAACYPSLYEGFGLPVLEALSCGTPCVAATGSCLEEAGGEAAIYVSPDDPTALAAALRQPIESPHCAEKMRSLGLRHAARFDNAGVAEATHLVYEKALSDFGK